MEEERSLPPVGLSRIQFAAEKSHFSPVRSDQMVLDCISTAEGHSADELKCELSANYNCQRCNISKKNSGIQRTFSFSFSVYLWITLPLLVMLTSVNSSTSFNDLCQNVTWSSDVKCNCSVNVLSNSSCEHEQNETFYYCRCGNNIMCNINVVNTNGSQVLGNCSCENGFTGLNCETYLVNYCGNVTCLNGGTCIEQSSNSSYFCHCRAGFSGVHCEHDIDFCNETNFCQNNGSCVNNGLGGYTCNCTEGYEGFNCSLPNCTLVQCANGGMCDISSDEWVCNCTEGFEGLKCETDVDECRDPGLCLNNSTCSNSFGSYQCICTAGYTGHRCESDINECNSPNTCLNNATCTNYVGGYHCNCTDGYIGANCSTYNGCLSNPCMQNGSCVHVNNTFYYCECQHGFMGLHCEKYDRCVPSPCLHGICSNVGDSYKCSCNSSHTGVHCNITNSCFDPQCKNGGSCIDLLQNSSYFNGDCSIPGNCFSCMCSPNFTGNYCEMQISQMNATTPVGLIVGLTVGLFFLVLIVAGIILFLVVMNKRKNLGTYHPSRQEVANARLEINGGLKPPPEERLI